MSPHYYEAFGLAIRSNHPLAGLRESRTTESDLDIEFVEGAPEVDSRAAETTAHTGSGSVRGCEDGGRMLRFASHSGESAWSMPDSCHSLSTVALSSSMSSFRPPFL